MRLNQTSALIEREGVFYGQCSEICGFTLHYKLYNMLEPLIKNNYVIAAFMIIRLSH